MKEILTIAETYLREKIAPEAEIIDQNSEALKIALAGMGKLNLLGLKIDPQWGGSGLTEAEFYQFQMMIARYSGALAFLQTQHQSAVSQLEKSDNQLLKQRFLPHVSTGKMLLGVGFSQLRRQGEPIMKAIPLENGYKLMGVVPWITGYGFFDYFIIGATLPNGQELYGVLPCKSEKNIIFSQIMPLAVMECTNTVSAQLNNYFLKSENIVTIKPQNSIHQNDTKNVLHQGFFALGCAFAGLDVMEKMMERKNFSTVKQTFDFLTEEVSICCEKMFLGLSEDDMEYKLKLRCQSINLAFKVAQAGVLFAGGAANALIHPAQRVYREALMFSISGQTLAVMETCLNELVGELSVPWVSTHGF
jgi:alkylation response protein AidB-like acyl-CoA dehydrogenase